MCTAGVLIGFDRTAITVTEGDTAAFNLQVVSENLGDLEIQVELFTQDGSATGTWLYVTALKHLISKQQPWQTNSCHQSIKPGRDVTCWPRQHHCDKRHEQHSLINQSVNLSITIHLFVCLCLSIDASPIYLGMHCLSIYWWVTYLFYWSIMYIYLWCPSNPDADYATRRQPLSFTSQRVTIPLSIETFVDGLTEGTENFIVNLENVTVISRGVQAVEAASRVTLNSTMLLITILDSDCKCYCRIWVTFLPFILPTTMSPICVLGRYLRELVTLFCISYGSTSPRF